MPVVSKLGFEKKNSRCLGNLPSIGMKKGGDLLIFFLCIAILFWNPLSYELFYSNQPAPQSKAIYTLYVLIPLVCVTMAFVVRKWRPGPRVLNLIFGFSWMMIFTGMLILGNTIIGLVTDQTTTDTSNEGFIFKPNTKVVYSSPEFNFDVEVNSLGIRDDEVDTSKKDCFRILCFGDSWTFGWGVHPEESWPKKLMKHLHDEGFKNVEIINCGQPGVYSSAYLTHMKKILPKLKADLVLVGVLQLDDLAQLYEVEHNKTPEAPGLRQKLFYLADHFLKASFGNYSKLLRGKTYNEVLYVKDIWTDKSKEFLAGLQGSRRLRFDRLDDTLKSMFIKGELNPTLLQRYIDFPDRHFVFNNPHHPATKEAIDLMSKDLKGMKEMAEKYGAPIVFINMPYNQFTGHKVVRMPTDELDIFLRENNRIDSIYRKLALDHNMEYIELTGHFLKLASKDSFFFKYDGHPTRHGYQEIADFISGELVKKGYFDNP